MSNPQTNVLDIVSSLNLEAERKIAAQTNRASRVKIERGNAWLIRFLPFPQGKNRQPFACVAQHWVGKGPGSRVFNCKRHTPTWFDGDPDAVCQVCDVAEQMYNDAPNDEERDEFYAVTHRISFRAYCLVFAKQNERGAQEDMAGDEILIPHEFLIPKSSFNALEAKINRSKSARGATPLGLLDLYTGTDLWAIRDKKNSLTFDISEQGPGPIFTEDDQFDAKLARVWKQLKQPSIKFLDDNRLADLADMILEKQFEKAAKSLDNRSEEGSSRSSGRSSAPRGRAAEIDQDEQAPARSRTGGSRGGSFARAQAALEPAAEEAPAEAPAAEEDQIPGAEVPPVAAARAAATRRAPVAVAEDTGTAEEAPAQEQESAPPITNRRAAGAAPVRAPAATGRVAVPPSVAAGRRAGAPVPPVTKPGGARIEDESPAEDPPEENADPAPPAEPETAPAPAAAARPAARGSLQGALKASVSNITQRGR